MKIPVLTYHSARVDGNDYETNDHVAFAHDLRLLHGLGLKVGILAEIVKQLGAGDASIADRVAISFDDGTDFDYRDLPHPKWGWQRSMFNIMQDFRSEFGPDAQPDLHATSFVVVSPEARQQMDKTCLAGRNWYSDDWWAPAAASGLMAVANHSWDHTHPTLTVVAQQDQKKGRFDVIDNYTDADAQIRQATEFLAKRTGNQACRLFAYPYGQYSDYLVREYLPKFMDEHQLDAAFTTVPDLLSESHNIWKLPRLVCGEHWKCSDDLATILSRNAAP